jgi:hypothetical protein
MPRRPGRPHQRRGYSSAANGMEPRANITPDLAAQLDAAESSDVVDVIVELAAGAEEASDMAAAKRAFDHAARPVAEVVAGVGGEVVDGAWINHTLHARVPAGGVPDLADAEGVAAVDVPHAVQAE